MFTIIPDTSHAPAGGGRGRKLSRVRRVAVIPAFGLALLAASAGSALAAPAAFPGIRTVKVGVNPANIVISAQQAKAYVENAGSDAVPGSVSVLSLSTHRQLAQVGTGGDGLTAIGLVQSSSEAYIGAFASPSVQVLNTTSLKLTGTVQVGPGATDIVSAEAKSGEYAYVTESTNSGQQGAVAVIRASDNQLVDTITLPAGAQTAATTGEDQDVWVGSVINGTIWVIDTSTQQIVRTIAVPDAGPVSSIAFSPDGTRAWVYGLAGVSVVDVVSGNQLAFVPITRIFPRAKAPFAGPIALTGSGHYALVVNSTFPDAPKRGNVAMLNTSTLKVLRQVRVGTEPTSLALDTNTRTAYVTNYVDGTVSYFRVPK